LTSASPPPVEYRERHTILGDVREGLREIRAYRELLYQLTTRDIRLRYKQAVMGFGWALFMPMLVVLAGVVVRGIMAQMSGQPLAESGLAGVAVKAVAWAFFVGAVGFASTSLVGNASLVSKVSFPREVLPLAAVLAQGFDTLIGATALLLVLPLLGVGAGLGLLWVVPLAGLLFVLTVALCLLLAGANLFFRDVKYIVQVLLTFGIFFTPVVFDAGMAGPRYAPVLMLNPLAPVLEGLRLAVVENHNLLHPLRVMEGTRLVETWSPWFLAWSGAVGFLGLALSLTLFRRLQTLFAEWV